MSLLFVRLVTLLKHGMKVYERVGTLSFGSVKGPEGPNR